MKSVVISMIEWEGRKVPASYLGDGVYAIFDGYGVWLHANDHLNPTDRIYLEPEVLKALNRFVEQWKTQEEPS